MIHLFLAFAAFIMTADKVERARMFDDLWVLSAVCLCIKLNRLGMAAGVCGAAGLFLILERISYASGNPGPSTARNCGVSARILGLSGSSLKRLPALSVQVDGCPGGLAGESKRGGSEPRRNGVMGPHSLRRSKSCSRRALLGATVDQARDCDEYPVRLAHRNRPSRIRRFVTARMDGICLRKGSYFLMFLCAPLLLHTIFWILTAPEPLFRICTMAFRCGAGS